MPRGMLPDWQILISKLSSDGRKKMYFILQSVTELALHSPGVVPAAAGVADPEGVGTPLP